MRPHCLGLLLSVSLAITAFSPAAGQRVTVWGVLEGGGDTGCEGQLHGFLPFGRSIFELEESPREELIGTWVRVNGSLGPADDCSSISVAKLTDIEVTDALAADLGIGRLHLDPLDGCHDWISEEAGHIPISGVLPDVADNGDTYRITGTIVRRFTVCNNGRFLAVSTGYEIVPTPTVGLSWGEIKKKYTGDLAEEPSH